MDVAYYLSELLGQLGEVNVPGLGYFAQIRVPGYYNAADSTFYPPKNKVQFDQQTIDDDDDTLAQYIAEKKNISLASSRYFTEKYISSLKQEAIMKDVPLADLGYLYIEGAHITFKPADIMKNDPAVYGYTPLRLEKLEGPSFTHQAASLGQVTKEALPEPDPADQLPQTSQLTYDQVIQEAETMLSKPETPPAPPAPAPEPEPEPYVPPVYEPAKPQPVVTQPTQEPYIPPMNPEDQEEFVFHGKTYVPPERRGLKWLWVTLLIVLGVFVVGVLGILAIHKFRPALYNQIRGIAPEPVAIKLPVHKDSLKTDTIKDTTKKVITVSTDTTAKTKPEAAPSQSPAQNTNMLAVDSTKTRYEVIGSSARTLAEANRTVSNFGKLNLNAYIVKDAPGPLYKISLGSYPTHAKAMEKINELNKAGKAKDAWPLTINPKK